MDAIHEGGYLRVNKDPSEVDVITFGSPRVGNLQWATAWQNTEIRTFYRIVNSTDIIPTLPTRSMDFYHHNTEIYLERDQLPRLCKFCT